MNCTEIKAAIDIASRRNPLSSEASVHMNGCQDCRRYSDHSNALLALLSAQPRVEAPADFGFKLRARIVRTQAQPAGPFAFLENFLGQTFSLKQAAASLAALAVMAAATTFYFTQGSQPAHKNPVIAHNSLPVVKPAPVDSAAAADVIPAPAAVIKMPSRPRVNAAVLRPAVLAEAPGKEVSLASNVIRRQDTVRLYNREKGQVNELSNRTVLYGAEGAPVARPAVYGF
jgi:hypothetical protein